MERCGRLKEASNLVDGSDTAPRLHGYRTRPWYVLVAKRDLCTSSNFLQRDNVLFGQEFDPDKYWDVIERSSLLPDLLVLPDGDLTEVRYVVIITLDACLSAA